MIFFFHLEGEEEEEERINIGEDSTYPPKADPAPPRLRLPIVLFVLPKVLPKAVQNRRLKKLLVTSKTQ